MQQRSSLALSELLLAWVMLTEWNIILQEETLLEGEYGKPALQKSGFEFNISHSGDYALVGIDNECIGVDIQQHKHGSKRLARRIMDDASYNMWRESQNREVALFDYWAYKESILKWKAIGLSGLEYCDQQLPQTVFSSPIAVPDGYSAHVCGSLGTSQVGPRTPIVVPLHDLLMIGV